MELTRRDAVAALAAVGVGGAAVYGVSEADGEGGDGDGDGPSDESGLVATAVALADVLYPSEVSDTESFVRTYVRGRTEDEERRTAMAEAAGALDARAREEHGVPFRELAADEGDALLRDMGLSQVAPDPEGEERERVRFYLVNELLYALLSSPKGGALVDIESPPGEPGGLDAYQQGPQT